VNCEQKKLKAQNGEIKQQTVKNEKLGRRKRELETVKGERIDWSRL